MSRAQARAVASVLYLDRSEVLAVSVPPYIDPTERGSYDTDELDALEAACAEPTPEVVTDDPA